MPEHIDPFPLTLAAVLLTVALLAIKIAVKR